MISDGLLVLAGKVICFMAVCRGGFNIRPRVYRDYARESRRHWAVVFFIMGMPAELVGVAVAGVAATGGYIIRPYGRRSVRFAVGEVM